MDKVTYSTPLARSSMAYVLAGGRGTRLMELTERRAKPAVYFGGKSRIIDFALSNALNSGIRRIAVATQYKAHSLIRHLQRGWNFLQPVRNESFDILPASQRVAEDQWYAGTADAVFQNIDIIDGYAPEYLVILAGDHVYKMDYERMLVQHVNSGADVTVACIEVPRRRSHGIRRHARRRRRTASCRSSRSRSIRRRCRTGPAGRWRAWASTCSGATSSTSSCDATRRTRIDPRLRQGHHSVPRRRTAKRSRTASRDSCIRSRDETEAYWRDVGTLDAYWEANIDLTDVVPALDLYDRNWPIWTYAEITPPAKFVHDVDGRRGLGIASLVSGGCIVSGSTLRRSLLFTGVHLHSYGSVENAVVLPYVDIGRRVRLSNVVIDATCRIPAGLVVGEDPEVDAARFRRTANGRVPHHAADDRPARPPDGDCASFPSRPRSTRWSRPAASATSSPRCRRRSRARA